MSTNNSEGNEINERYNCVWNCNYCYRSLLSQGFSVSRCANGNDCHCFRGLDQPSFELTALLTCNYCFLLTKHSRCEEITGRLSFSCAEMRWFLEPQVKIVGCKSTVGECNHFLHFPHLLLNVKLRTVKLNCKLRHVSSSGVYAGRQYIY